jgi:hypothetical protein
MSIRVKLEPSDVVVYHVFRDGEGNAGAERLKVDERGLKSCMPLFIEVERKMLEELLYIE